MFETLCAHPRLFKTKACGSAGSGTTRSAEEMLRLARQAGPEPFLVLPARAHRSHARSATPQALDPRLRRPIAKVLWFETAVG